MTVSYKRIRTGILILGTILWVLGIAFVGTLVPVLQTDEYVWPLAFSQDPEQQARYHFGRQVEERLTGVIFAERLVNHWPEYTLWEIIGSSIMLFTAEGIVSLVNHGIDCAEILLRRACEFTKNSIKSLFWRA